MRRSLSTLALAFVVIAAAPAAQDVTIGTRPGSLKFAVLGDAGTGERPQYEVGDRMWSARSAFAFDFVLLTGDNMYGRQLPEDFVTKFQKPYERLLGAGVRFYAALGNHDKPENRFYAPFNMNGERYYSFSPRADVRFVVLDTNLLDPKQLEWARETLVAAREPWKIAVFHHPIYSDGGRHGSNIELRVALEPLLVASGVEVVFTGHDHFYERIKPQKTVTHFVLGSGGQLRKGDVKRSALTAAAFDQDQSFMLVELAGDQLFFQTISRTGVTVDAGVIDRRPTT